MNPASTIAEIRRLQRERPDGWRKSVRTLADGLAKANEDAAYLPPIEHTWDEMTGRKAMGHLWMERDIAREQRLIPTANGRTDDR